MRAFILSTGDELVRGRTQDRNAPEIARAMAALGVTVVGVTLVGDDEDALHEALLRAAATADLVFMSGGLGPTEDDCTRRAVSSAAGVGLARRADLVEAIEERWRSRGREMPPSNAIQADLPVGAEALPNGRGTAPGFALGIGDALFFALPGPPHEMRHVLEEQVLPRIRELLGEGAALVRTRTLCTFGWPESKVGERLGELMERGRWPRVGTSAELGTIKIVLHDEGPPDEVTRRMEATEADVRERLGRIVFGAGGATLAGTVVGALAETGRSLATAESCTGGLLAGAVTDVPGSSAVFPGGVVAYANAQKTRLLGVPASLIEAHGSVSEEVALAMATGAREAFGTDLGVALTGIAGPGGGTEEKPVGLVHVAADVGGDVVHRELRLLGERWFVRKIAVKSALDLVRRALESRSGPRR